MIQLYDLAGSNPSLRFSPYCWRIRMALAHKGLDPVTVPWRFHERGRLPGAPTGGQVPVIVDGDEIVSGSTTIAFHLESRHSNGPSLFGGPGGEAHVRFILAWADSVLTPGLFPIAVPDVLPVLHEADRDYFRCSREKRLGMTLEQAKAGREGRLASFRESLAPMRRVLEEQPFLGGDEPSYADYGVFGSFQWLRCIGAAEILEEGDSIIGWRDGMLDLFDGLAREAMVHKAAKRVAVPLKA